jgi:hypothetical protein
MLRTCCAAAGPPCSVSDWCVGRPRRSHAPSLFALFWLSQVPTTRALSLVNTGDKVMRDMFYNGDVK